MIIVVVGASGRTGIEFVKLALAAGHDVKAVVRQVDTFPIKDAKLKIVSADVFSAESLRDAFHECHVVFSALGVTGIKNSLKPMSFYDDSISAIIKASKQAGVRRVLCLTSVGTAATDNTPSWYRMTIKKLLRHKYADMQKMEKRIETSGFPFIVIRPYRLTNEARTSVYRVGSEGILKDGQTISRADVADFALRHLEDQQYLNLAIAIAY